MKPTHRALIGNQDDVTAWQFSHADYIPAWVFRVFHLTGGTNWKAITEAGQVIIAKPGDWAVVINQKIIVLSDAEFKQMFKALT